MEFQRVDRIEQGWISEGMARDRDYVWLAHGKYVRDNPDFRMDTSCTEKLAPIGGVFEARDTVSRFFNEYISAAKDRVSADRCCMTGGCKDGVNAALRYFETQDDRNVLYLVPTFRPLIDIGKAVFDPQRICYLKHFNEHWEQTIENIKESCLNNRIGCIVYANPNNPSGIMYPNAFLAELGTFCNANRILVIEDGAYFLHYDREEQTTITDFAEYAISLITSVKLLLGKHKVGGAVLSAPLDVDTYAGFAEKVPYDHQIWFQELLNRVAFEAPALLEKHLADMFSMSEAITTIFTGYGFVPLYAEYRNDARHTSIGPVIALTFEDDKGVTVSSEMLFDVFTRHFILTTPMDEGIRINSRGITEAGKRLLQEKMPEVIEDLKGRRRAN